MNQDQQPTPRHRLYVSDLDGTLLNEQAYLSEFSRVALARLLTAGVAFTVATARSAPAVSTILSGLPTTMPIVEQNGACVTDLATGKHLAVNDIPLQIAQRIVAAFRRAGADPIAAAVLDGSDRLLFEEPTNVGTRWYIEEKRVVADPRLRRTDNVMQSLGGQVLSLTTLVSETVARQLAAELLAELGERVQIRLGHNNYVPGWWELSVLDAGATKAAGIATLRKALGMEQSELVVFGDAENDTDMFRCADIAVAVRNAVPELLELAAHVVGSNVDDGVVHWLLEQHAAASEKA